MNVKLIGILAAEVPSRRHDNLMGDFMKPSLIFFRKAQLNFFIKFYIHARNISFYFSTQSPFSSIHFFHVILNSFHTLFIV